MRRDMGYFEEQHLDKAHNVKLLRRLYPFSRPYSRPASTAEPSDAIAGNGFGKGIATRIHWAGCYSGLRLSRQAKGTPASSQLMPREAL